MRYIITFTRDNDEHDYPTIKNGHLHSIVVDDADFQETTDWKRFVMMGIERIKEFYEYKPL